MPEINYRKRLAVAFLWAVLGGVLFGLVGHAAEDEIVIKPIGICDTLEPYTYWWGFWGCENR